MVLAADLKNQLAINMFLCKPEQTNKCYYRSHLLQHNINPNDFRGWLGVDVAKVILFQIFLLGLSMFSDGNSTKDLGTIILLS